MMGIQWLTTGMRPGDSLVFTYSGHGSRQRDYSGEEVDGYNETLCPVDFRQAGEIVDDELNHRLINPLPQVCERSRGGSSGWDGGFVGASGCGQGCPQPGDGCHVVPRRGAPCFRPGS